MKLVTATIPEHVLDDLRDTLLPIGIKGMTISPARQRSLDEMDPEFDRSRACVFENALEIRLETVVSATIVDEIVGAILAVCNKAAPDGISILVSDVIRGVRIRNSELVTEG
ncbi:P-II family nitrogen regulator [Paraburkholderia sp. LEh10]|jgi:nitrogen regulatory protein PII|uniref:P-II family nitrogen regulator n=1 Tax=Paraburkholderia sp. LEh10 TaxID=2821353 RepID=UPI001AE38584|nr:P-II family nitrogen regulator [Paraburkholderia sp. LEh10]MBP0594797.1 P-II family nitrogen regulator [Paraburkholderia sp. LEh10]